MFITKVIRLRRLWLVGLVIKYVLLQAYYERTALQFCMHILLVLNFAPTTDRNV
jgi:hypothetical protein